MYDDGDKEFLFHLKRLGSSADCDWRIHGHYYEENKRLRAFKLNDPPGQN